jgi:hypothetical protein
LCCRKGDDLRRRILAKCDIEIMEIAPGCADDDDAAAAIIATALFGRSLRRNMF